MKQTQPIEGATIPRDEFSEAWRRTSGHPAGVVKQSVVEMTDWYGNSVTWVVKTVRVEGEDTVFLQRNDANGGSREVLPPEVTTVLARHRDGAAAVNRKRAARTGAATRKAKRLQPVAVLKASGQ